LGPPEIIVSDSGSEFVGTEFRQRVKQMAVEVKQVPVESHNSVGKVERYHIPLRRAYKIIRSELKDSDTDEDSCLQMAVKAINDTARTDGLVPTLLVFGAYPRISATDAPTPTVLKRAEAIQKAMSQLRTLTARRKITDASNIRNGPKTTVIIDLPLTSEVLA
jgi:hypothetical protein